MSSAKEMPIAGSMEFLLAQEHARQIRQYGRRLPVLGAATRRFEKLAEDRYRMAWDELGITIEADRLRRDGGELIGEVTVKCDLPGAATVCGNVLGVADMNLSSLRTRNDRAKQSANRAKTGDQVDWIGIFEEFVINVLTDQRTGSPPLDLREVNRPDQRDSFYDIDGLIVTRHHPSILFGPGGGAKSYLVLRYLGILASRGVPVLYCDWELDEGTHRDRLERLFGREMPKVLYVKCTRPLVYEADRLAKIVRDNGIQYAAYDSVVFACDGPPESAETAGRYMRAVRMIGCGSLHIAHTTKGEGGDRTPFGSIFWHNSARSTWFVAADNSGESDKVQLALFHRKANLGRLHPPIGYQVWFDEDGDRTLVRRNDVADSPELSIKLSIPQRMEAMLRRGPRSYDAIAEELETDAATIRRNVNRYKNRFAVIDGGRVGLIEVRGQR